MRAFPAVKRKTSKTEDWLAERVEFELSRDFLNRQYGVQKRQKVVKRIAAKSLRETWSARGLATANIVRLVCLQKWNCQVEITSAPAPSLGNQNLPRPFLWGSRDPYEATEPSVRPYLVRCAPADDFVSK